MPAKVYKNKLNPSGFTLVELLVVIAIIAVQVATTTPIYNRMRAKADQAAYVHNLKQLFIYKEMVEAETGGRQLWKERSTDAPYLT